MTLLLQVDPVRLGLMDNTMESYVTGMFKQMLQKNTKHARSLFDIAKETVKDDNPIGEVNSDKMLM